VAIAAIDLVVADVMLVAEGDDLLDRRADRRMRRDQHPPGEQRDEHDPEHGEQAELEREDETRLEDLGHRRSPRALPRRPRCACSPCGVRPADEIFQEWQCPRVATCATHSTM
jgi:hypothetical protein